MNVDYAAPYTARATNASHPVHTGEILDRLDEIMATGRRLPFGRRIVDEHEIIGLIDQLRETLPGEISQARQLILKREEIITHAQAEADTIAQMARDRADHLVNGHGLLAEAKRRAEEVIVEAMRRAEQIQAEAESYRSEVDGYAVKVLSMIEGRLAETQQAMHAHFDERLVEIRNGITYLQGGAPAAPEEG
jgi:vacuolar-type H+-ATPase subunit H